MNEWMDEYDGQVNKWIHEWIMNEYKLCTNK